MLLTTHNRPYHLSQNRFWDVLIRAASCVNEQVCSVIAGSDAAEGRGELQDEKQGYLTFPFVRPQCCSTLPGLVAVFRK